MMINCRHKRNYTRLVPRSNDVASENFNSSSRNGDSKMLTARFNPLARPVCLSDPLRIATTEWAGHIPFAMFLIDVLRPRVVVELGTFTGVSYCAFCQAVKELNLNTRCYAIDTWRGDDQSGCYGSDILAELRAHHDPLYGDF